MNLQSLIMQSIDCYGRKSFFKDLKELITTSNERYYQHVYIYYSALFNMTVDIEKDIIDSPDASGLMLNFFKNEFNMYDIQIISKLIDICYLKKRHVCYIGCPN